MDPITAEEYKQLIKELPITTPKEVREELNKALYNAIINEKIKEIRHAKINH